MSTNSHNFLKHKVAPSPQLVQMMFSNWQSPPAQSTWSSLWLFSCYKKRQYDTDLVADRSIQHTMKGDLLNELQICYFLSCWVTVKSDILVQNLGSEREKSSECIYGTVSLQTCRKCSTACCGQSASPEWEEGLNNGVLLPRVPWSPRWLNNE